MPVSDFKAWLTVQGRVRLPLDKLLEGFAQSCPECPGGERREHLWNTLQALSQNNFLKLPAPIRQNWDFVGTPRLPRFVSMVREQVERPDFSTVKWVPELSFAAEVRQNKLLGNLAQINEFLIHHRGRLGTLVPYRERALQIFGDEKSFEGAVSGDRLYGKLPLAVIGAFNPEPPLPREDFPVKGKPLLLVENHHTYWSLLQWNAQALRYTSIAYGAGNTIMKSASALVTALQRSGASYAKYFGDIDPAGLAIPAALNAELAKLDQPPVRPAVGLYRLLLRHGIRRPLTKASSNLIHTADWLPNDLRSEVIEMWASGVWLPQEAVGLDLLLSDE